MPREISSYTPRLVEDIDELIGNDADGPQVVLDERVPVVDHLGGAHSGLPGPDEHERVVRVGGADDSGPVAAPDEVAGQDVRLEHGAADVPQVQPAVRGGSDRNEEVIGRGPGGSAGQHGELQ
jgi:hypothetical protein